MFIVASTDQLSISCLLVLVRVVYRCLGLFFLAVFWKAVV